LFSLRSIQVPDPLSLPPVAMKMRPHQQNPARHADGIGQLRAKRKGSRVKTVSRNGNGKLSREGFFSHGLNTDETRINESKNYLKLLSFCWQ